MLYGDRTDDISRVGTGTQSAVIIGMLELVLRRPIGVGLRLFCVEEPAELFLHPQAQRRMGSLLRQLASEPSNFVFITTHSPKFLAVAYRMSFALSGACNVKPMWNVNDPVVVRELEEARQGTRQRCYSQIG